MTRPSDGRRIADILIEATSVLTAAGIPEARTDAEILLGFCLGMTRTELYLRAGDCAPTERTERFQSFLKRRENREPAAYITGEREFWSLPFYVSPAVLIPRPETEFLLETVLNRKNPAVTGHKSLDLCCGSGVIGVVLARELGTQIVAVDISPGALEVAKRNCRRHGADDQVHLVMADLTSCFQESSPFSLIVSNPPYVRRSEIEEELEPEVSRFEPHLALDGGSSGLDMVVKIRDLLPGLLCSKGDLFMEIGEQQGADICSLFHQDPHGHHYEMIDIIKDYSGRDRVAHIRRG